MALSTTVPANDIGIVGKFTVNNPTFTKPTMCTKKKCMLHSTATPGAPAQNFFGAWNNPSAGASVEFVIDDKQILQYLPIGSKGGANCIKTWHSGSGPKGSCNRTHIGVEMCEPIQAQLILVNYQEQSRNCKYPRKYSVQRIQMELKARGFFTGDADGVFGPKTEEAVKAYQTSIGARPTGAVNRSLLSTLQNRKGSYALYDTEAATPFFIGCYNNAVTLFAWLYKYLGGNPLDTICHCEGHTQGVASNHADVMHWFPFHGKNMDNFRQDVQAAVNGTWVPLGSNGTVISETAKAVATIVEAGIINTPDYWYGLEKDNATVYNNYVMALLRQAGQYGARKSFRYALPAVSAAIKASLNKTLDVDYWLNSEKYDSISVKQLVMDLADVITESSTRTYDGDVDLLAQNGIIAGASMWHDDVPCMDGVRQMIREAGVYLAKSSYLYGIDIIEKPSGMNSPDYWRAGAYSLAATRCLLVAIAKMVDSRY